MGNLWDGIGYCYPGVSVIHAANSKTLHALPKYIAP